MTRVAIYIIIIARDDCTHANCHLIRLSEHFLLFFAILAFFAFAAPRFFPAAFFIPSFSISQRRPRYLVGPLTNNIKRPILERIMPRYNSRTSGHRKGELKRIADGIWSSVCHGRHATSVHAETEEEDEKASSRENNFELHTGETIPSPTYGSEADCVRRAVSSSY